MIDWIRNESYKELLEAIGFFGLLLGIPTGGLGLYLVIPIGILLIVLKIGVEIYDGTQDRRAKAELKTRYVNNWALLRNKIIALSDEQYFEKVRLLLKEIDLSQKPPKQGSIENWKYLNQYPEISLKVYLAILQFIEENDLGSKKQRLEAFCAIGFSKIDDFAYVFKIFERTTDKRIKQILAEALILMTHVAPTNLLMLFLEYVIQDYPSLQPNLINSIINRAQDFNPEEIQKILKRGIYGKDRINFYLTRTRYFFGKAYDYSANDFKEDANSWLNKIIEDFGITGNRVYVELLNPESGLLLAMACQKLGDTKKAIFVLERVLNIDPSFFPAISLFVMLNETRGDYEKVKNLLIKSRKYVVTDEWGQGKLSEYGLL